MKEKNSTDNLSLADIENRKEILVAAKEAELDIED